MMGALPSNRPVEEAAGMSMRRRRGAAEVQTKRKGAGDGVMITQK